MITKSYFQYLLSIIFALRFTDCCVYRASYHYHGQFQLAEDVGNEVMNPHAMY